MPSHSGIDGQGGVRTIPKLQPCQLETWRWYQQKQEIHKVERKWKFALEYVELEAGGGVKFGTWNLNLKKKKKKNPLIRDVDKEVNG